jgi:hypothetical protein
VAASKPAASPRVIGRFASASCPTGLFKTFESISTNSARVTGASGQNFNGDSEQAVIAPIFQSISISPASRS